MYNRNTRTPQRFKKMGAAAAVATGLSIGTAGIAWAASGSSNSGASTQQSAPSSGGSPANPNAGPGGMDGRHGPHPPRCPSGNSCLGGTVESISSNGGTYTIVVADRGGFWRTIQTSSSTTFDSLTPPTSPTSGTASGSSSAVGSASGPPAMTKTALDPSTIKAGDFITASGAVDANHTTLDAVSVNQVPAPPAGAQGPGSPSSGTSGASGASATSGAAPGTTSNT